MKGGRKQAVDGGKYRWMKEEREERRKKEARKGEGRQAESE